MRFLITSIFFFFVLNLSSIHFYHAHGTQGGNNLFVGKFPIPANTPDPIDIDTSKAQPVSLNPLIYSINGETPVYLQNTGTEVQLVPLYEDPSHYISGGPLGNDTYRFWYDCLYYTDHPDQPEGTTIDHQGARIRYRGYFINNKYTQAEALTKRDGMASLIAFTPMFQCKNGNKTNENLIPLFNAIRKIRKPLSKIVIKLSVQQRANDALNPCTKYYAYPGAYEDSYHAQYYCATIIVFSIDEERCATRTQIAESFGSLTNSTGEKLINYHEQCNVTRPIVVASGVSQGK